MAQTKRKRRNKHRGNAAGVVEARGRTSRRETLSPAEQKKQARSARGLKPPTWNSALVKAGLMSVLLFLLTQLGLFGASSSLGASLVFAAAAMILYTPLAYLTDRMVYRRMQRKMAKTS